MHQIVAFCGKGCAEGFELGEVRGARLLELALCLGLLRRAHLVRRLLGRQCRGLFSRGARLTRKGARLLLRSFESVAEVGGLRLELCDPIGR